MSSGGCTWSVWPGTEGDLLAALQLLPVERRAAGDKQIDLQLCRVMDHVGRRPFADGAPQGQIVDVEFCRQPRHERRDVTLFECDDEIDVGGRAWLASE